MNAKDQTDLLMTLASSRDGYPRVVQEARKKLAEAQHNVAASANNLEEAKKRHWKCVGHLESMQQTVMVLEGMAQKWGLDRVHVTETLTPSHDAVERTVDPITQEIVARKKAKKVCMYREPQTKKWCQVKLTSKKAKATGYCTKHAALMGIEG